MGFGRAVYIFIFPLVLTGCAFVLSLVTFFSGYEKATGLRNVHFMTLDLSKINVGGITFAQLSEKAQLHPVYTIATNGWCYGPSIDNLTACETPHEPFYFGFGEILDMVGLSEFKNSVPNNLLDYDKTSKAATYALWIFFVVTIVLSLVQFVFIAISMCSVVAQRIAWFFATFAFLTAALGSILATAVYSVYSNKINDIASEFGANATLDSSGLGCAWATAAALLAADILYLFSTCFCSTTRTKYVTVPDKGEYIY